MLTVQNGKGSRCRIGDFALYLRNFAQIDFSRRSPSDSGFKSQVSGLTPEVSMRCPNCGAHNLPDRVHCWCCNRELPKVEPETET
jgi:hypothetical protein